MKRAALVVIVALGLLSVAAEPATAWRGGRVSVFVGSYWGPPYPYPYWAYPPPYYVYAPPTVIVESPPVYIAPPPIAYWYYCESAAAYYPTAPSCPEPWIKVPERRE
jgi:hypothetical protein